MKNVEDLYPLSPLQQGLLFHALMEPESPAYVNQSSVTLRNLDPELFRQTWERVLARHAILRTAFFWENLKEPVQAVRERVKLPWQEQDWRAVEPVERSRRLEELRAAERSRPLPLSKAPLMRFVVVRMEDETYELLWTFHHLLLDGWSTPLLFEEVLAIYGSLCEGRPPALPPVRPYRQYIAWLQRRNPLEAEGFWRRYLAGFTAPTPLELDRPGTRAALTLEERSAVLTPAASGALQSLAVSRRLTLNTLAQGAWALLLARYSGAESVVFGSVVAGRPADLPGVESMIGLFINTLPVHVRVPATEKVLTWLEQLQRQQIEMREYEQSSLSQVQGWSEVPRGTPLFDSLLICENYPLGAGSGAEGQEGLRVARMRNVEMTGYPLRATVAAQDGVSVQIGYDPTRFDAASVERRVQQLCSLLAGLAAVPESLVGDLPLLSEAERHQLLLEWSDSAVLHRSEDGLDGLFAQQAARTPDQIALIAEEGSLTYAELARRSRQLARFLERLGVGPDVPVGIVTDRSPQMVVSLLGTLAAGGAYVPVDPAYPEDRVSSMLEDSRAPVVLTQERYRSALAGYKGRLVCLDTEEPEIARSGQGLLARRARPDQLAYVIYTSGSTGRPKGVQVTHRGVANFLHSMAQRPGIGPEDVLLAVTTLSFDIAGLELYLPLVTGARVVLASREAASDGFALRRLLASSGATMMQATPATWRLLLAAEWDGAPPLRVLCGGEALPRDLADQLLARASSVWNLYGPTETTVWSAVQRVEPASAAEPALVSIGRPIANTSLRLVDRGFRPVPLGAPGELLIGGTGLARGYLGRPDLTAERFIPDAWGASPGARLYRTGDLARYTTGGDLEFLGRIDHQVKVRGYRIELGEIEVTLRAQGGVREVVVLARGDAGDRHLAAYVVGDGLSAAELRPALRQRLPEYMIPSVFVRLEALPQTPNGKVDRKALARIKPERETLSRIPPRDLTELRIAHLFEELLATGPVGATDDFFALGGHSLLAVRLLARLRREIGCELQLSALLQSATVERLAAAARSGDKDGSRLVTLQPAGSLRPVFCIHPVGGHVLCYAELARRIGLDRPVYGLQALPAGHEAPSLESLAALYLAEVRKVQPRGPYAIGGWSMGGILAFEMARQLTLSGETVEPLFLIDAFAPRPDRNPEPLAPADLLALFGRDLGSLTGRSLTLPDTAPGETAEALLLRVHEQGIAAGIFPPDLIADDVARLFAVFRANLEALLTYRGGPYHGPLLLFRAADGPHDAGEDLGWGRLTKGPLEILDLPADHDSIVRPPAVDELARRLATALDRPGGVNFNPE